MKRFYLGILLPVYLLCALILNGCQKGEISVNRERNFNDNWKFILDSLPTLDGLTPDHPEYNDSHWLMIDLPHDWSIAHLTAKDTSIRIGPFAINSPGATSTGYALGGTAWYRKHFILNHADKGKLVALRFDGVYMETEVWVNGQHAGSHVYGYTPFNMDITPFLNDPGTNNIISIKVSNAGRNSRWYSGSGLYRNVCLSVTNPVHIPIWGVRITTPRIAEDEAEANMDVRLQNSSENNMPVSVKITVLAPGDAEIMTIEDEMNLVAGETATLSRKVTVKEPVLWSPSSPGLYKAVINLTNKGKIIDQYIQPFGFRSIEVSAEKGFLLNGQILELKGGCLHHDNGLLGSAAYDRAEERRVQIMKANGFNAIRTSHNPPSEAFLNACDRLGMLVIDETFDMWERPKNQLDYHRFFRTWWMKDVESMILRDRNHPCIIMWSIGNEISERADTSGVRIGKSIISFIKQLDDTRPFTNAICEFWDNPGTPWEATANAFDLLTVGGYNYQYLRYEEDHTNYPQRIMMGTESVAKDAFGNWQQVEKHPYVIGDFVWTGMDYLGETGIGHTQYFGRDQKDVFSMPWPWFNAWCGDIDLLGNKKPQMMYRDVIWDNSKIEINVHAPVPPGKTEVVSYWGWPDEFPHWNWNGNEDKVLQVSVYTKGDFVKLFLNGREIGQKDVGPETKLTATFDVPYEPGEIKAIAYMNELEIASKTLKTTGMPAGIRLVSDRNVIRANRSDLAFITIEVVDEFGQVVTDADYPVKIAIEGNGEMVGSGNACPWDMKSIGNTVVNTFHGKAMVIVRPYAKKGEIAVQVSHDGLTAGNADILVQ
jgi:beta-galactosidase